MEKRRRKSPAELTEAPTDLLSGNAAPAGRGDFVCAPGIHHDADKPRIDVNRIFSSRDERLRSSCRGDIFAVKTVRPDQPEPIPVRTGSHRMGQVIVRFVALLVIAIGLLLLAWLR